MHKSGDSSPSNKVNAIKRFNKKKYNGVQPLIDAFKKLILDLTTCILTTFWSITIGVFCKGLVK